MQPRPVVILSGASAAERELAGRTGAMLQAARVPWMELPSTIESPLSILEYEAIFNDLVQRLVRHFGVDQRNWPSKGKDDPLYGFARVG